MDQNQNNAVIPYATQEETQIKRPKTEQRNEGANIYRNLFRFDSTHREDLIQRKKTEAMKKKTSEEIIGEEED